MRSYLRSIGVVDFNNRVHAVTFKQGVNVITGKSSTGKSAMIEIFDYCFGSSDYTVPEGIITDNSQLYFVIMSLLDTNLVLARRGNSNKVFLKEEPEIEKKNIPTNLSIEYFDDINFWPLEEFKKELGRFFGLNITDVDIDMEAVKFRGNRKSPTPSVRSFTSFMLQHQNLVANKHAIFYRFDEKEKREQAIEHFKIFAGFVDQEYFLLSQKLNDLKRQLKQIELQIPRRAEERRLYAEKLEQSLHEYASICGVPLIENRPEELLRNPSHWLDKIQTLPVVVASDSDEHLKQKNALEGKRDKLIGEMRSRRHKLSAINSSIRFAKEYAEEAQAVNVPSKSEIQVSECPFCHSQHNTIESEANKLTEAISWLNDELRRSPYVRESFESDAKRLSDEITSFQSQVHALDEQIALIEKQSEDLKKRRSLGELALKAKLRVEGILEDLGNKKTGELEEKQKATAEEIKKLQRSLKDRYAVDEHLNKTEAYLQCAMAKIGSKFDFEPSYRPIDLRFSLDSFDLWHEKDKRQIFLRAMGSGANWLYCHVTLFLALHKFFCSLGNECKIPSILFLDQPSQVYFPSIIDTSDEFDPEKLAQEVGAVNNVDEDIRAVENLYSQLVAFCKTTAEETGMEPQIIVTDHADNLKLTDGIDFEALVQGRRWRTRGFIEHI